MKETEEFDFYDRKSIKVYNLNERIRYQLKMLDSMDAFTKRHSENVANITCRLCEKLKLGTGFTIYCTTCAYLHDIGKLFIPPSILQKNGKLTEEEYEIMKTHTTIGNKMCMQDLKLRPFAAGALYHHEALDGTGYPNGVVGNKIPYEAQIIRVADEFEAITAKRQYKSHIGIIETLNILISHARPTPPKNLADGFKKSLNPAASLGKIDKKVLKALFKVVIDDTEYEIAARSEYLEFLESEIKRIKDAMKYYNKMIASATEENIEYYKAGVKMFLRHYEDPLKCPEMLEELEHSYKMRKEHIEKLYSEVKQIKRLSI